MTTTEVLFDLLAHGITLQPHGDRLRFYPKSAVTPELLERIKQHKADLLRLLVQPDPLGNLQPQENDSEDWREFTTDTKAGIERPNAPPRTVWDKLPDLFKPLVGGRPTYHTHDHTRCDKCGNTDLIKTIAGDKGQWFDHGCMKCGLTQKFKVAHGRIQTFVIPRTVAVIARQHPDIVPTILDDYLT